MIAIWKQKIDIELTEITTMKINLFNLKNKTDNNKFIFKEIKFKS